MDPGSGFADRHTGSAPLQRDRQSQIVNGYGSIALFLYSEETPMKDPREPAENQGVTPEPPAGWPSYTMVEQRMKKSPQESTFASHFRTERKATTCP